MTRVVPLDYNELYDRAVSRNEIDGLEDNLFRLYQLYRHTSEMPRLLASSKMTESEKIEVIYETGAFQKNTTFSEVVFLLLRTHQVERLFDIYKKFLSKLEEKENRIVIQLFSFESLSPDFLKKVSGSMAQVFGKKVELKNLIDKRLIGGIMVKLPDGKIYDFSLRRRLSDFKYFLLERN